jgi:four helix bundle protein
MSFDHENLDAYDAAIDLIVIANDIVSLIPRGHGHLADQLRRAATSVPLNVAEGAGEFAPKDKARFYRIARRSATECAAILDVCRKLDLVPVEKLAKGRDLLLRLVAMLIKLAKRCEQPSGTGAGTHAGTEAGS